MYNKNLCLLLGLLALATSPSISHATEAPAGASRTAAWNSDKSDFPADKSIIYGELPNGLTYAIRPNDRPQNEVLIRMAIDFGSAAEQDNEQGLAHFIEHMAFNGTTNVPEGEMVKILERLGLSFGADTNASTGYNQTTYMLDVPNAKQNTLDQAFFLLRETASEISFDTKAIEDERGIILEEKRVRENFSARSGRTANALYYPNTYFTKRYPIGTEDVLKNAPAQRLKDLYKRFYTPDRTKLVIVGPVDPVAIEKMIVKKFSSWKGESRSLGEFDTCMIDTDRKAEVKIFTHPKISEAISANQFIPDKKRYEGIERSILIYKMTIANAIISNRINKQLRAIETPILGANLSFAFNLCDQYVSVGYSISGKDGSRDAMIPFVQKHVNSALEYGFQQAEVDEILKAFDNSAQNSIKSEATRQSRGYASALTRQTENVLNDAQQNLLTWLQVKPFLRPEDIHKEFKTWFNQLQEPLIYHTTKDINQGNGKNQVTLATSIDNDIENNEDESHTIDAQTALKIEAKLINAFKESLAEPAEELEKKENVTFAYTDFGAVGKIATDKRIDDLDIRTLSFENGVKLNIKSTKFEDNRVRYSLRIAGGNFHFGKENNILADFMDGTFGTAALGKHDIDELRSVILGTTASPGFRTSTSYFGNYGSVAPDDLLLQFQLLAAYSQDPGYREEAIRLFKRPLAEFYKTLDSSPGRAMSISRGKILTDGDPRFSLQKQSAWEALDFKQLREALGDALKNNAVEIGIVGDISEEKAIETIAKTFGALPKRKTEIPTYDEERIAPWSDNRGTYDIPHKGEPDQLAWNRTWITTDDSDYKLEQVMGLLARIINLNLTEELREKLGATYGSNVGSSMSSTYKGRGSFTISTSGDIDNLDLIETTIEMVVADALAQMPAKDIFERARTPRLESYKDWRLRNSTWVSLVDTAQSEPIWLEKFRINEETYRSITRKDVWDAAKKFLASDDYFTFRAIPEQNAKETDTKESS